MYKQIDITGNKKIMGEKTLKRDLLIVLMLSISIRSVFLLRSFSNPEQRQMTEDSHGYTTLADNLIKGQGFGCIRPVGPKGEEVWTPEFCRTPGYPLLIAGFEWLTGNGRATTIVFQQILGILLCLIVMIICQRNFGRTAGLAAGLLIAFDLQAIGLSNLLLPESLFTFLLFYSVFLIVSCTETNNIWFGIMAGLFLGICILIKPVGMVLPLVLFVVMMIYAYVKRCKRILLTAVIISVFAYLSVCGWVIRNGIVCGEYVLSSVGRSSLLQWSSAMTLARSDGISREIASQRLAAIAGVPSAHIRYIGLSPEQANKVKKVAISTIVKNKSSFMKEYAISFINLFFGPEKNTLMVLGLPHIAFGVQENQSTSLSSVSAVSVAILAFEVFILGSVYVMLFITLWRCIRLHRLPSIILICLIYVIYILVLSSLPPGCPRYRSAVIPMLVIIAAATFGFNKQNETN